MGIELISLARQIDIVFRQVEDELLSLSSGTVFIQIRNNIVGKFGVRHWPIEGRDGKMEIHRKGLSESQVISFRQTAIDALKYKRSWTHGEILIDFTTKQNLLCTSVQLESNYNLAAMLPNQRGIPDNNAII